MSEEMSLIDNTADSKGGFYDLAEELSLQLQRDSRRYAVEFKDPEED